MTSAERHKLPIGIPALLSRFDVDDIATEALLFQAGYLTLHGVREEVPHRPI